jgi:hypothetical protein
MASLWRALSFGQVLGTVLLLTALGPLVQPAHAQGANCKRLPPEDVRLLIRARDAAGVTAAFRCRPELLADERVRSSLSYAFAYEAFSANEAFVTALRRGGLKFVVGLAPMLPENQASNLDTPLGVALTQGNRAAVDWLLQDVKPGDLRPYRRLAMPALQFLLNRSELGPREQELNAALQAAVASGLPTDADNHAPYFESLLTWWRTQDLIDYTDNSSFAGSSNKPLPASAGPLWKQISDTLAPADPRVRTEVQLRAAERYAKLHLDALEASVATLKQALAGAVRRPGALVVDSMGIIDIQRYGRVPRESVEATIQKMEARAQRLRATLVAQVGTAALPAWAQAPGVQGTFGEVFGLRLGSSYRTLVDGREPPPLCTSTEPPRTWCARAAMPALVWQGEPRLTEALNAGGRFPPGGRRTAPLDPANADGSGIIRLELPLALRKPGLPTSVDVVLQGGRIETLLMQGGERQLAGELRRVWGDPAEAFTEWFRVRTGRFENRAVGTVALNSGEEATLTERVYTGDDDRPVARYRWQGEAGIAEMLCSMGCNLAVSSSRLGGGSGSSGPPLLRPQDQALFARMPKPPVITDPILACEAEPLLIDLALVPLSTFELRLADPSSLKEIRKRQIERSLTLWARTHLAFEGPEGCVHRATAVRLWQAATGAEQTGRVTQQDVDAFLRESTQARERMSKSTPSR